jgi:hypothetical protein
MRNILLLIIGLVGFIGCSNNVVTPQSEPYQQEIDKFVAERQFDEQKPVDNVLSKSEVVTKTLEDIYNNHWLDVEQYKKSHPEDYQDVDVKPENVVLVEDLWSNTKEKEPYYYFIGATKPNGDMAACAVVTAMSNNAEAGKIGLCSQAGPQTTPQKMISPDQAIETTRSVVGASGKGIVKAVLVPNQIQDYYAWGYAVQFENNTRAGESVTYWINPNVYTKTAQNKDWVEKQVQVGELSADVFNKTRSSSTPITLKPIKYFK